MRRVSWLPVKATAAMAILKAMNVTRRGFMLLSLRER
jgi:hypothetical protein